MPSRSCLQCVFVDKRFNPPSEVSTAPEVVCLRAPPSVIVIYNDDNGHRITSAYPPVNGATPVCGCWKQRHLPLDMKDGV